MSKKALLFFIGIIFFSGFNFAYASLIFTEVMYYPSDTDTTGEWVELYNNGSSDILIKSDKNSYGINAWRFKKGLTTEYYINSSDFTISAGEYIVLADNSSLFNNVLYKVIDSSVSLSNTNVTDLAILDEAKVSVATLEYTPSVDSQNTGKSLQLINGSWIAATSTPGTANESVAPPPAPDSSSNGGSSSSASSVTETKTKVAEEPKIKTQITTKTLGFVGLPFSLQGTVYGYQAEQLYSGKYFWNFGDGDSKEMQVLGSQQFTHTYLYPGDYAVSLEYYSNPYSQIPDAVNKIKIKIVPLELSISKVGDQKDFFVELSNSSIYDMDISNWTLSSLDKIFTLPRNSNILAKNKIILSSQITYFTIENKNNLKLITPTGQVISEDSSIKLASVAPLPSKIYSTSRSVVQNLPISPPASPNRGESLGGPASVMSSNVLTENSSRLYVLSAILFVFLGISGGLVYFIRRKSITSQAGSDFDILDE